MDIDLLSKMVKEIILDSDRVVLPGLGSFVAELVPSTFSDKGYTINPPYRKLSFRSKPDEGDELAAFYASINKIDKDMAERVIRDFVAELKPILHTKKTIVFPGLGRLRATKENTVFFVADEDLDIYPAGFGLEPISLKTHQETKEEVSAAVAGLKSLLEETVNDSHKAVPESIPEPEQLPEPIPAPEPEPVQESVQVDETVEESPAAPTVAEVPVQRKSSGKALKVVLAAIAAVVLILLIALAIVGRAAPEWVDQFLYSPEELKILNYTIK